jgi:3-deoxy-D-manno-octulosonate 8-phosphate phosphatase KdsC-like HAD superfamily phosphatase
VNYICENKGGKGAFREFADLIIRNKSNWRFL